MLLGSTAAPGTPRALVRSASRSACGDHANWRCYGDPCGPPRAARGTRVRCDSASAIEAGNDIRTALVCFGTDATHGYERCHENSLIALGELLGYYLQSSPTFTRDRKSLESSVEDFSELPV